MIIEDKVEKAQHGDLDYFQYNQLVQQCVSYFQINQVSQANQPQCSTVAIGM